MGTRPSGHHLFCHDTHTRSRNGFTNNVLGNFGLAKTGLAKVVFFTRKKSRKSDSSVHQQNEDLTWTLNLAPPKFKWRHSSLHAQQGVTTGSGPSMKVQQRASECLCACQVFPRDECWLLGSLLAFNFPQCHEPRRGRRRRAWRNCRERRTKEKENNTKRKTKTHRNKTTKKEIGAGQAMLSVFSGENVRRRSHENTACARLSVQVS